jgi:hypothetical protein
LRAGTGGNPYQSGISGDSNAMALRDSTSNRDTDGKGKARVAPFVRGSAAEHRPDQGEPMVAAAVKEQFGLSVVPQVVEGYDPTKSSGRQLGKKGRDLFEVKRAEFLASADRIGITH